MRPHRSPRPAAPRRTVACGRPLVILLSILIVGNHAVAQDRPTFTTTVELIQFQIAVAGGDEGEPLTSGDFVLEVDGRPRGVALVYPVRPPGGAEEHETGSVPPAAWRQYLYLFDATFNTVAGLQRAQEAAVAMVRDRLQPSDLVAVAMLTPTSGLRVVVPFTADREQVRAAIRELGLSRATRRGDRAGFLSGLLRNGPDPDRIETLTESERPIDEARVSNEELLRELQVLLSGAEIQRSVSASVSWAQQLEMLGRWLRTVRGPKSVILFTEGISDELLAAGPVENINSETRFGSASVRSAIDDVAGSLRGAQATLHLVDPTSGRASGSASRNLMADGTGGSVVPLRELARVADELATRRYVIGFPREPGDEEGLDIRLWVTAPGAEIVSAPDRLVPPPLPQEMDGVERQLRLAEIVSKGLDPGELRFSAVAVPWLPGGTEGESALPLPVVIELPRATLDDLGAGSSEGLQLEFLLYLLRPDGSMIDILNHGLGIRLDRIPPGQVGAPARVMASLSTPPGRHRVRIVVRESRTGRTGARTLNIDVPDPHAAELQPPVSALLESRYPGLRVLGTENATTPARPSLAPPPLTLGGRLVAPAGGQTAVSGERFRLLVQVAGFTAHPVTGRPEGSLGLLLDGAEGTRALETQIQAAQWSGTTLTAVIQAQLPAGLRPVPVDLIVRAADAVSGQARDSRLTILPVSGTGG